MDHRRLRNRLYGEHDIGGKRRCKLFVIATRLFFAVQRFDGALRMNLL
jgi:hypothetical protein